MSLYLVTGAAGFIGSALCQKLLSQGNEVVGIDNLSTGFFYKIPDSCVKIIGNTYDDEIIKLLGNYKFDGVFHIAGQSGGVTSYNDPIYDMKSNIESTLKLLEYCNKTGCKKFVYASSMSVYGDKNVCPVSEDASKNPTTFYAIGKLASENYMNLYSQQFGIKCTALRLNNVYGPGQNMENLFQGMVSIFLAQAIKNHHIHVMGSKDRFRDFVYIDDVVDAFIKAIEKDKIEFKTYNVSTGIATTVEKLIEYITDSLPFNITVKYEGSTRGDQFGIYCDNSKIVKELNWHPSVTLTNGLKTMIEWALNNKR